jgi:hypothetical protein
MHRKRRRQRRGPPGEKVKFAAISPALSPWHCTACMQASACSWPRQSPLTYAQWICIAAGGRGEGIGRGFAAKLQPVTHTSAAWRLAVAANLQAACARMLLFFSFVHRQIVRFSFLHLFLSSDCNDRRIMDLQAGRRFKSASRLHVHACCCLLLCLAVDPSCAVTETTIDWRRIVDLSLGLFGFGFLTDGRTDGRAGKFSCFSCSELTFCCWRSLISSCGTDHGPGNLARWSIALANKFL